MSNLLSLNWRDFVKGLVIAVLTPIIVVIQQSLEAGQLTFNWKAIGVAALAAAAAYLLKNLVTNSDDQLLKKENK